MRASAIGPAWSWLWGFAEAALFFVVPDVLFTLVMLESPKRGWRHFGMAIAGALVAGSLMYTWAAASPAQARAAVAAVPFLGEKIITPTEAKWNTEGTPGLFKNPLGGVPYKVYAVLAPAHVSLPMFVLISIPLRLERMLLSMIVFVPLSLWVHRGSDPERAHRRAVGLRLHAAFWILVYGVYWSVNYS